MSSTAADPASELHGDCVVLFAFDLGQAVDLERASQLATSSTRASRIESRQRATAGFQSRPKPLSLRERGVRVLLEGTAIEVELEMWLYEFGGLSVIYRWPMRGYWESWVEVSARLDRSSDIAAHARARAEALLATIRSVVDKPNVDEIFEDYPIFRFRAPERRGTAEALCSSRRDEIARLLRAESGELSEQEVGEALAGRVAFGSTDLALVDWNGAVLFDDEPDDVIAVLEIANLHLVEMRFLDKQLDRALDQAYDAVIARGGRGLALPGAFEREIARISRHQVDAAVLFERVNNAFKLYNDQYLARVYRQASSRLRLAEWNVTILRKLDTLDDIYQKIQDRAESRRMEFLEWIVIILIAISLILPFVVPGYVSHG